MVNPAHIRDAEIFGMPEYEPQKEECPQCGAVVEDILKCEKCGMRCCVKCRTRIEKYLIDFHVPECAIEWLLEEMERLEDEADKYWQLKAATNAGAKDLRKTTNELLKEIQLEAAAKKAATTGSRIDLHNYLKLRRELS